MSEIPTPAEAEILATMVLIASRALINIVKLGNRPEGVSPEGALAALTLMQMHSTLPEKDQAQ